ncbi:MAG: carboxypeptidase-like regulatory domain-containing protein [Pirellulales bacterium]
MSRPTNFKVGGTVYWTISTYTDAGVLVDADSNPVVAIRRNGVQEAEVVTVTKRASTTGLYDCSYNPANDSAGDFYSMQEVATISTVAYHNLWSMEAQSASGGGGGDATAANQTTILANIAALNDFDHTTETVITDSASRTASQADVSLLATESNVNNVGTVAGQTYSAVLALNDFNPATDTVANVTLVGTTTTNTDMRGTDGANTVAPDNASISAILADTADLQSNQGDWLTATTTVASNMRGTDNALLAASAPTNWSVMDINGSGEITTSNPASGGGSAHTAEDVRDLILAGDKTPITMASNSVSNVVLVGTTTNLTNGGSGGDDAATIYAYFTAGSNEDAFKADVSGLATSANLESVALVTLSTNTAVNALNDFDPANDTVARVTLVDTTTDLTNQTASGPTAQEIVDTWGNQAQGVYTTSGTLGFYLDAQVSSAGAGGTGLYQATVRVQDASNDALQGARVNVDGTTLTLTTNSQGEVTFNLDSGVYLLEVSPPAGYDTPTGQVLTVLTSDPADTVFTLQPTNPDAGGCTPPWLG